MSFISGKHLPRRTFLRGLGVTVALPLLDAMVPAAQGSTGKIDPTRLICMEEVHGLAGCNKIGASQYLFAPETTGPDFTIVPDSALSPLRDFQDRLTIISNTDVRMAEALAPSEIGADHFRSSAVFLTQTHPRQTQGSDIRAGTSMDQLYAQKFGQNSPIPSMQFCIESLDQAGGCSYNYSCVYTDSVSWASPTDPLPMVRDPRVAFEMMFGAGGSAAERAERMATRRSILDWIAQDVSQLRRELGPRDLPRLDGYLENVREVERRIQMVEAHNSSGEPRELPEAPAGVPDSFEEHMKLMFDLQVLALENELTRVITFKLGRDATTRTFPESGSDRPFHPASHHGNNPERVADFNRINRYRVSMLPYFLQKLRDTRVGDSSLLDQTVILWGSPMADGNVHNHRRCPLMLMGGANGRLPGNLHLKAADGTPMANVMLSVLNMLGMDLPSFGDSTGEFDLTGASV